MKTTRIWHVLCADHTDHGKKYIEVKELIGVTCMLCDAEGMLALSFRTGEREI